MFESKGMKKVFGPDRWEVTGDCRNLENAELHDLYCLLYVVRVIRSMRNRWVGRVARVNRRRVHDLGGET